MELNSLTDGNRGREKAKEGKSCISFNLAYLCFIFLQFALLLVIHIQSNSYYLPHTFPSDFMHLYAIFACNIFIYLHSIFAYNMLMHLHAIFACNMLMHLHDNFASYKYFHIVYLQHI